MSMQIEEEPFRRDFLQFKEVHFRIGGGDVILNLRMEVSVIQSTSSQNSSYGA